MIDSPRDDGEQRTGLLRGLITETLIGAVLGAAGGLVFGLLFGSLWWCTSHAAQTVLASAWAGTLAAAAAGSMASFASMVFGREPLGWGELFAGREGKPARRTGITKRRAFGPVIRSTSEALRGEAAPPEWARNGHGNDGPPATKLQ